MYTGDQVNHTEEWITDTASLGPATILIGVDQRETCFVPAGIVNHSHDVHTETFVDQLYQTTTTNQATYQVSGVPDVQAVPVLPPVGLAVLAVGLAGAALWRLRLHASRASR